MAARRWTVVCAGVLLAGMYAGPVLTQEQAGAAAAAVVEQVPSDLRPLLTKPQSEFRLVTQRYTVDRSTLNGNYDGGRSGRGGGRGQGGPGGGRGAGAAAPATPPAPAPISLSTNRIARLKRFDMNWLAALNKLDAGRLTEAARADLAALKTTIDGNQKQLETDTATIAEVLTVGAIRAGAGPPERDAHQAAGRQFPGRRRACSSA